MNSFPTLTEFLIEEAEMGDGPKVELPVCPECGHGNMGSDGHPDDLCGDVCFGCVAWQQRHCFVTAPPASGAVNNGGVESSCPHLHQTFPGTKINKCVDCEAALPESVAKDCICHQGSVCTFPGCDLYHHEGCSVHKNYHVSSLVEAEELLPPELKPCSH